MSRYCPLVGRKVVYLDCLECESKECQTETRNIPSKKEERGEGYVARKVFQYGQH